MTRRRKKRIKRDWRKPFEVAALSTFALCGLGYWLFRTHTELWKWTGVSMLVFWTLVSHCLENRDE